LKVLDYDGRQASSGGAMREERQRRRAHRAGIPFLHGVGRVKLELLQNRSIAEGCVYLMYKVVRKA
jgi:hypothetical protein